MVFGDRETFCYVLGYVAEDQRCLVVYASNTTAGNRLFVVDLNDPRGQLVNVVDDETSDINVIISQGGMLYAQTNRDEPNSGLVKFNLQAPTAWQDVNPESEHVLDASAGGGYSFTQYIVDAIARVEQYSLVGQRLREIVLPGPGDASGFRGTAKDTVTYYSFQNYKNPSTLFRLDMASGGSSVYRASRVDFDSAGYVSKQVLNGSKDGTRVAMIITQRADSDQNQTYPTMLNG